MVLLPRWHVMPVGVYSHLLSINSLHFGRAACRDCWAQEPGDRPSMAEVVPRLRALLEGLER